MIKFVAIEGLPRRKNKTNGYVDGMLQEFMSMNVKFAKVEFDAKDYKNPASCQSVYYKAIKAGAYPITVKCINKEVYLIRRDL